MKSINFDHFFKKLDKNTWVLTPNNRLSSKLVLCYAQAQTCSTWETVPFLSLSVFARTFWQFFLQNGCALNAILLTPLQTQALWQQIVDETQTDLLQTTHLLIQIEKAWKLLQEWNVSLDDFSPDENLDQQLFYEWAQHYQNLCKQHGWIDEAQLPRYIIEHLARWAPHIKAFPHTIYLIGFNATGLPPIYSDLLSALAKYGTQIITIEQEPILLNAITMAYPDAQAEMYAMAQWAYDHHQKTPHKEIICVVPKLTQLREELTHIFYQTFNIDRQITGTLPFNIGGGVPLYQLPIIQCAFQWLGLPLANIELANIHALLQSPFWLKDETEKARYPLFMHFLLKLERPTFWLADLIFYTQKQHLPQLHAHLVMLNKSHVKEKKSITDWLKTMTELLQALGWPSDTLLSSEEFQALQQWHDMLDAYADLDYVAKPCSYQNAYHGLMKLAKATLFQTETLNAHIHVIGLLEAAGLFCDQMWVMGMDDQAWPSLDGNNAFLPFDLQRKLNMPHSSPLREWTYCEALTQQLLQGAPVILLSFAQKEKDEHFDMSPLIKDLPSQAPLFIEQTSSFTPTEMDLFIDECGPALPTDAVTRGGSDILKQFAACPFRAFASYRLHANAPHSAQEGLPAKIKGVFLHQCLEIIWRKLKSQKQLLALSKIELAALIQNTIEEVCRYTYANESILTIEKKRLTKIIMEWLTLEKSRIDFEVLQCEEKREIQIGPLRLTLKIDRIDRVQGGATVLLDYKSSQPAPVQDWLDPKPREPQLPLYAITYSTPIEGIAFANLQAGKYQFQGMAAESDWLPKIKAQPNWQATLDIWKTHLTTLAVAFAKGHAQVDPRHGEQTCRQCQFQLLCRKQAHHIKKF